MKFITNRQVEAAIKDSIRIYLCGNLKEPSPLKHIQTDGYEIGISQYEKRTVEKRHLHRWNTEYNYIIRGRVDVFVNDECYSFTEGDLFIIEPNEPYSVIAEKGTKVIFSKLPGGNDKELV